MLQKKNWLAAILPILTLLAMLLLAPASQAAWDTNITDIVTDATTFFTSIKGLVITIVVFGIAIGFAKFIKKK